MYYTLVKLILALQRRNHLRLSGILARMWGF